MKVFHFTQVLLSHSLPAHFFRYGLKTDARKTGSRPTRSPRRPPLHRYAPSRKQPPPLMVTLVWPRGLLENGAAAVTAIRLCLALALLQVPRRIIHLTATTLHQFTAAMAVVRVCDVFWYFKINWFAEFGNIKRANFLRFGWLYLDEKGIFTKSCVLGVTIFYK